MSSFLLPFPSLPFPSLPFPSLPFPVVLVLVALCQLSAIGWPRSSVTGKQALTGTLLLVQSSFATASERV